MKRLATIALFAALWLTGCNLSEAERMDLSRSEVESIQPPSPTDSTKSTVPTVSFNGGNTISLSGLLTAARGMDYSSIVQVDDLDVCHSINCWTWELQAIRDGNVLISFRASSDKLVRLWEYPDGYEWADSLADIEWRLFRWTGNGTGDPRPGSSWEDTRSESASRLKIVDDRIPVSLRLAGDSNDIETGDTIRMEIKNESSKDTTLVASDYSGMRMVGAYEAKLGPGESATLQWLVLAAPGNLAWLEISWSRSGLSKLYTFPIR